MGRRLNLVEKQKEMKKENFSKGVLKQQLQNAGAAELSAYFCF